MNDIPAGAHAGWKVGPSISLELDTLLTAVARPQARLIQLSSPLHQLVQSLPNSWRTQWRELLGFPKTNVGLISVAAQLVGMSETGDYSKATLTIRELSIEDALAQAEARLQPTDIRPNVDLAPGSRLADLIVRHEIGALENLGLQFAEPAAMRERWGKELAWATRVLRNGDLHARFWHWLDRFYFEFYGPWRETRQDFMDKLYKRAVQALGSAEEKGLGPATGWLSPQHPLKVIPELRQAVQHGLLRVYFWVEPFEFLDSWSFRPGVITVSFAEAEQSFLRFLEVSEDVADRVKALSDPTRLRILRLIRFFEMDNTEMANFFGLARPTVSNHAKVLREAGLIETRRQGRQVRHKINPKAMRSLFQDLAEFLDLPEENNPFKDGGS